MKPTRLQALIIALLCILALAEGAAYLNHEHGMLRALWDFVAEAHDGLLAVATIVLAIYTAMLWRATVALGRDSKTTAEVALKIAQEDFVQTNRPWVTVELQLMGMKWDEANQGYPVTIRFVLENVGKSPATNLSIDLRIVPLFGGSMDITGTHQSISNLAKMNMGPGLFFSSLFPGEQRDVTITSSLMKEDLEGWEKSMEGTNPEHSKQWLPVLTALGCVSYRFAFGTREVHQTGFSYDLYGFDGTRGNARTSIPRIKGEYELDKLVMTHSFINAALTD